MQTTFQARVFTAHDQERFASLSGDFNPMHMDQAAARRTQAGTCAVHGVHAFLWSLEQLATAGYPLGQLASARVDFTRFIRLGAPVTLDARSDSSGPLRAELVQDERRVVGIDLAFADRRMQPRESPARMRGSGTLPTTPAEPSLDDLKHARGSIAPPGGAETLAAELFPRTVAALGTGCTVSIGLLSSLVGMVAPGLHSIFSAIRIGFETKGSPDWLRYEVALLDDRFRMVTIHVEGCGFAGSAGAFVRFPPVRPPALRDLEEKVGQREFATRRALVIGGSRGLGACTAKLIAAGGGSVVLTYLNGRSEAEEIRNEIAGRYGAERCAITRYDTAADPAGQISAPPGRFSHAYYFATGRIAGEADAIFDRRRLESFLAVYVDSFERLTQLLLTGSSEARLHMFYPSSVFVEARPRGMTEYAMAKAAGEILCADLMRAHRNLTVSAPRLPRVLTDQTATVPPVPVVDPIATLLPLLRAEASEPHP